MDQAGKHIKNTKNRSADKKHVTTEPVVASENLPPQPAHLRQCVSVLARRDQGYCMLPLGCVSGFGLESRHFHEKVLQSRNNTSHLSSHRQAVASLSGDAEAAAALAMEKIHHSLTLGPLLQDFEDEQRLGLGTAWLGEGSLFNI